MTIFPNDILFAAGGLCLERFGTAALRRAPTNRGGEEMKETFARAVSANAGYYLDRDGILRKAGTDILRPHFLDPLLTGTRSAYLLTEPARTNLFLRSEEFDNAAWIKTQCSVGANADVAPDGAATADRLIEDGTVNLHGVSQSVTITADAPVAVAFYVKSGPRTWAKIKVANGANQVFRYFNLANGTLGGSGTAGTATLGSSGVEPLGSGWYRILVVATIGSGLTTATGELRLASADGVDNYAGDGVSYIVAWGAQFENNVTHPSSYIKTTTASATRAVDKLSFPFDRQPMAMSIYTILRESGLVNTTVNFGRVWQIAESAGSNRILNLRMNTATGKYSTAHETNGGGGVSSSLAAAPVYGDSVELLVTLNANGSVQIAQSINGAAVSQGAASAANALASAWGDRNFIIGASVLAGPTEAPTAVRLVTGARGADKTIADFRTYFGL